MKVITTHDGFLDAKSNQRLARPTMYQVVKEMVDKMGYAVKVVRVTKRVHEAYFAQLYLTKLGNEMESVSFDLRPSDAINIAVICKKLLAREGINAEQFARDLKSFELKMTFEDVFPAEATIVEEYLQQVNYEADGWVAHQVSDIWAKTSPD
ncbi:unnamed protein product [Camellia sinensis]